MTLSLTILLAPSGIPLEEAVSPSSNYKVEHRWTVNYKTNEFNEPTRKVDSISGLTGFGFLKIHQHSVLITLFSSASLPNTNKGKVAIRTPHGIVRLTGKFSSSLTNRGYASLDGANGRKFIGLLKKYKEIKLSVKGTSRYYVADIDCRGFTKAWRKTGWR